VTNVTAGAAGTVENSSRTVTLFHPLLSPGDAGAGSSREEGRTVTGESKTKQAEKPVEDLELNRETVADLTEQEAEAVQGGLLQETGIGFHTIPNYTNNC
jgi:hypothetical protein